MRPTTIITLILCLFCAFPLFSQKKKEKATRQRISLDMHANFVGNGHWIVQVSFEDIVNRGRETAQGYTASYSLYKRDGQLLDSRDFGALDSLAKRQDDGFGFSFSAKLPPEAIQIRLVVRSLYGEAQQSVWLPASPALALSWTNLSNPLLPYARVGDTIRFESAHPIFVYAFGQDFAPAVSPLQNEARYATPYLDPAGLIELQPGQLLLAETPMLCFAQLDTTGSVGVAFRVMPADFPKFKKISNLAGSMIYIATREEINSLLASNTDQKLALDQFWLDKGRDNELNAQRLVKAYYQRIAHANEYFGSFKEGWKTDRGMVYTVFGRPHVLHKTGDTEQWIYYKQQPNTNTPLVFEFTRVENVFSNSHYVLTRHHGLGLSWYAKVDQWRMGTLLVIE